MACVVLCHYSFRTWRNMGKGWANQHGHSHGRPRQFDVGVEVGNFRPVQLTEVVGWQHEGRYTGLSLNASISTMPDCEPT